MTTSELAEIIKCGETSTVQFKLRFDNAESIASEMIAMSNSKGGMIIFGIEDKNGNIIVSYASKLIPYRGFGSGVKRAIKNQPDIEFTNDVDGEQFIVRIPRPPLL